LDLYNEIKALWEVCGCLRGSSGYNEEFEKTHKGGRGCGVKELCKNVS